MDIINTFYERNVEEWLKTGELSGRFPGGFHHSSARLSYDVLTPCNCSGGCMFVYHCLHYQ